VTALGRSIISVQSEQHIGPTTVSRGIPLVTFNDGNLLPKIEFCRLDSQSAMIVRYLELRIEIQTWLPSFVVGQ